MPCCVWVKVGKSEIKGFGDVCSSCLTPSSLQTSIDSFANSADLDERIKPVSGSALFAILTDFFYFNPCLEQQVFPKSGMKRVHLRYLGVKGSMRYTCRCTLSERRYHLRIHWVSFSLIVMGITCCACDASNSKESLTFSDID